MFLEKANWNKDTENDELDEILNMDRISDRIILKKINQMSGTRVELVTSRFSVLRSASWATRTTLIFCSSGRYINTKSSYKTLY